MFTPGAILGSSAEVLFIFLINLRFIVQPDLKNGTRFIYSFHLVLGDVLKVLHSDVNNSFISSVYFPIFFLASAFNL